MTRGDWFLVTLVLILAAWWLFLADLAWIGIHIHVG